MFTVAFSSLPPPHLAEIRWSHHIRHFFAPRFVDFHSQKVSNQAFGRNHPKKRIPHHVWWQKDHPHAHLGRHFLAISTHHLSFFRSKFSTFFWYSGCFFAASYSTMNRGSKSWLTPVDLDPPGFALFDHKNLLLLTPPTKWLKDLAQKRLTVAIRPISVRENPMITEFLALPWVGTIWAKAARFRRHLMGLVWFLGISGPLRACFQGQRRGV